MKKLLIHLVIAMLSACHSSSPVLTGGDIRLWKKTPAWALAKAVEDNDTSLINQILIKEKVFIDYQEPKYGQSLLFWAIWNNKVEMVDFLLSKGANPNLHDYFNGESPMILACEYSDTDAKILSLLLRYGGNPNDYVKEDETLTHERSKKTPLIAAATTSLLRVQFLIEAGADIEMSIEEGMTPLFWATLRNHFDIVKYLLEKGADHRRVYFVNHKGDTLCFDDILAKFPYQASEHNEECLQQIRQFIEKTKK